MLIPRGWRDRLDTDLRRGPFIATSSYGSSWNFPNNVNVWSRWSKILDFPRIPQNWEYSNLRPVSHTSISFDRVLTQVAWKAGDGNTIFPSTPGIPVSPEEFLTSVVPAVSESVFSEQYRLAFDSFADQFPEDIGLGNFLLELKDLAGLIPKLENSVSKTIAGTYLNSEFNVKPLIRDLQAIFGLCASITARIDYLRKTVGKPTRIGYSAPLGPNLNGSHFIDYGSGSYSLEIRKSQYKCNFRAGAWILQNLTHLDDFYGLLRAFMGKTGLNNPIKIVWNAIPFSFVLDWFVNVSSYLGRWKIQGADGQWDILNATCSYTQTVKLEVVQWDRVTGARTLLGSGSMTRYERILNLPLRLIDLPSISALNPKQLTLLLAMST